MATGQSTYADLEGLISEIYEGSLHTLQNQNVLGRTVTQFRSQGVAPRVSSKYNAANPRKAAEGADVTPTKFDPDKLSTLTIERLADQFLLTDQRLETDPANLRTEAAMAFGEGFAQTVDADIASDFAKLTGATINKAGAALTWEDIIKARAIMQNKKIVGELYCVLHPYQWLDLVLSVTNGNELVAAPQFADSLISTYFTSTMVGGVMFVVTPSVVIDADADATGAMYHPLALAYDERKAFSIEAQRNASREAEELNAKMWYGHGIWDASRGIKIVSDATEPA